MGAKPVELVALTRNMVISADLEKSLNLELLSGNTKAIYEPEQFPGAILRFEKPYKASVLVFASGKVVITGLLSESQIKPNLKRPQELVELNQ